MVNAMFYQAERAPAVTAQLGGNIGCTWFVYSTLIVG